MYFKLLLGLLEWSKLHLKCLYSTIVTRLGDLLHFGELFKASVNNYFAQIA